MLIDDQIHGLARAFLCAPLGLEKPAFYFTKDNQSVSGSRITRIETREHPERLVPRSISQGQIVIADHDVVS